MRLTSSAIRGTDLHMIRGTLSGMAGAIGVIGIFPPQSMTFPIGAATATTAATSPNS